MSISISNEIEFGNFFYCNGDIIFGNRKAISSIEKMRKD